MIAGSKGNFFKSHYDWLVAGTGAAVLIFGAVSFITQFGADPDEEAANAARSIERMKPAENGVKPIDMTEFGATMRAAKSPMTISPVEDKQPSFLASERRVKCKCGKVISGDVKALPKCPYCGEAQEVEKAIVLDADNDGLPDEWEKKYGLNPNDAADAALDKDADGFTNLEEFQAKTNPTDAADHPDYLDSLAITLPLKQTYMPFVFRKATQVPGGWRCEFFDPKRKNNYGRLGLTISTKVGEEIADSGFVLKSYEAKSEKREKKGMKGMMVTVDVSEATVERKSDKKVLKLVIDLGKKPKFEPIDAQATLTYTRGEVKTFEVVPGSEINLNGTKYKITEVIAAGKGAKVSLAMMPNGEKRTLQALE